EGGEVAEKQRKTHGLALPLGNDGLGYRTAAKQRLGQVAGGCLNLVGQLFVFGQLADEIEQQQFITRAGGAQFERFGHDDVSPGFLAANATRKSRVTSCASPTHHRGAWASIRALPDAGACGWKVPARRPG